MSSSSISWIMIAILSMIMKAHIFVVHGQQQVPCLYFFGDSQFDNGNNNFLITQAKANYPPYGIDYLDGVPTGRFTNGQNIADFLAKFIGFVNPIPPYATARGSEILKGVNYASGAAGILDQSGRQLGDRIWLDRQLINHQFTVSRVALQLGGRRQARDLLSKCVYVVNMGSNDYINNYYLPQYYLTSSLFTTDQFAEILVQKYSEQLRTLYSYGARKIAIFGLGFIGCIPQFLAMYPPTNGSPCVDSINAAVQLFNMRLPPLVNTLNQDLPGANFTYINITSISLGDPSALGITVANAPCCIVSTTIAQGQCAPDLPPCSNRNQYIFFDNFHPTQILNLVTASRSYNATLPSDAYPFDIRTLAQQ